MCPTCLELMRKKVTIPTHKDFNIWRDGCGYTSSHRWPGVVILESTGWCENERDVKAVSMALRARHTWV